MQKLLRIVHGLEDLLLALLLGGMILLAVTQIILRNFFDSGLIWADPLLRVMVLWLALLGALAATRQERHINIDVLSRLFTPVQRRYQTLLSTLFSAVVTATLGYYSAMFVLEEFHAATIAFNGIPLWLMAVIMPLGFGLIALRFFIHAAEAARVLLHPADAK